MIEQYRAILLNRTVPYGYRIAWLANFYRGPVYQEVQSKYGLSSPEFLVMFCLAHMPGLNAVDICKVTGRPRNSISRAVNQLAAKGYIARETDEGDRRRGILALTAKGRTLHGKIIPLFKARQDRMVAMLTPAELEALDELLTKLVDRSDDWAQVY